MNEQRPIGAAQRRVHAPLHTETERRIQGNRGSERTRKPAEGPQSSRPWKIPARRAVDYRVPRRRGERIGSDQAMAPTH
ncbi:hypothetical protein OJAV_G00058590 [Oryzias javanicus]|uniref:Uncharacterized protein n=1 Tax=Oryzias javanicus TaxID=123683 RepID=A0A3S2N293_ORYJA|nr:hypothetical protein OJAV_G00058590 [Oryzias javanicus]